MGRLPAFKAAPVPADLAVAELFGAQCGETAFTG